jgi:CPA1 family monovalent cation:H+ antiporter
MGAIETFIIILLAVMICVAVLESYVDIPYPILLVLTGGILGFFPILPDFELNPQVVFLLLLPPLLYSAAIMTSWRDFKAHLHYISSLAFGLVVFTTMAVGIVAHYFANLPWAAAFALGAIVSPPDAVAATALCQRLGVHRRIVTILEGESLINDASGLVVYKMAIATAATGIFSLWDASLDFLYVSIGGICMGLIVGRLAIELQRRLDNPPIQITISLLTSFASYLAAENIHVSGVLSTVTAGLFVGRFLPEILLPATRLQLFPVWQTIVFILNGMVFILIGLQLPNLLSNIMDRQPLLHLMGEAILVSVTVIFVRLLWVFLNAYVPYGLAWLQNRLDKEAFIPPWQAVLMIGWTGMRGIVSLAAALAIPTDFIGRDTIIFLTFSVIFSTLILQGLSLPYLIRRLKVVDDGVAEQEELSARIQAIQSAIARIDELAMLEKQVSPDRVNRLRAHYEDRIHYLMVRLNKDVDYTRHESDAAYTNMQHEALKAAWRTVLQLRNEGQINDETLHRIQNFFDIEDARLRRDLEIAEKERSALQYACSEKSVDELVSPAKS